MDPITLPSNQPADRFYRGGKQIAEFRGESDRGPRTPEDWIASTTSVRGHPTLGQTLLPGGTLLSDAVSSRPLEWLGPRHVEAFGSDTKLLVKLLDAQQRLPVHAHPDRDFAQEHLDASHGKAEAWYILTAGVVYLGLKRDVSLTELIELIESQNVEALLDLLHEVPVRPNQTVYVPPGLLHAIGPGILLAEVQEPEDLSILLEWRDFELDGVADGHLGLGFGTALLAIETRQRTGEEIAALIGKETDSGSVLPPPSREFFRLDRVLVKGNQRCDAGFAIVVVLDGRVDLTTEEGAHSQLGKGTTTVIPYAAGAFALEGRGTVLVARPPTSLAAV